MSEEPAKYGTDKHGLAAIGINQQIGFEFFNGKTDVYRVIDIKDSFTKIRLVSENTPDELVLELGVIKRPEGMPVEMPVFKDGWNASHLTNKFRKMSDADLWAWFNEAQKHVLFYYDKGGVTYEDTDKQEQFKAELRYEIDTRLEALMKE